MQNNNQRNMSSGNINPYQILGVTPFASRAEIKGAYRRLALENHPDKIQGSEFTKKQAHDRFANVGAAYEMLMSPPSSDPPAPSMPPVLYGSPVPSFANLRAPSNGMPISSTTYPGSDGISAATETPSAFPQHTMISGYLTNGPPTTTEDESGSSTAIPQQGQGHQHHRMASPNNPNEEFVQPQRLTTWDAATTSSSFPATGSSPWKRSMDERLRQEEDSTAFILRDNNYYPKRRRIDPAMMQWGGRDDTNQGAEWKSSPPPSALKRGYCHFDNFFATTTPANSNKRPRPVSWAT